MPPDQAEGHGLWVAKVVASRGFGRGVGSHSPLKAGEPNREESDDKEQAAPEEKWRTLNGEEQTDELFDREILRRMGKEFYYEVFQPAIQQAFEEGRTYQSIRDTIRREWKP